jgi:GH18 family chitinase
MPRTSVLVVAAVLALLANQPSVSATNRTDFVVSAYLPEWRYSGVDWSLVSQGVSHLILFSVEILPSGSIGALDRIPSPQNLQEARSAALKNGCRIMLCVGGNGRSAGYPIMVASKELRARFLKDLLALLDRLELHGVDYNWCVRLRHANTTRCSQIARLNLFREYPGYDFRTGYASNDAVETDYEGLGLLLKETRELFGSGASARVLSMAYYPDGRQEQLLRKHNAHTYTDFLNIMSYDQQNTGHHSSIDFGLSTLRLGARILPVEKLCLGVPFYGRLEGSGEWKTYEVRECCCSPD